jgi:hypothetical protein
MRGLSGPVVLLALAGVLTGGPRSTQAQSFPDSTLWWAVSYQKIVDRDEGLILDGEPFTAKLANGWQCEVGRDSLLGTSGSRSTTCTRGSRSLSFRVECNPRQPEDRVERRFRATEEGPADFIVVACWILVLDAAKMRSAVEWWPPELDEQTVGGDCRKP